MNNQGYVPPVAYPQPPSYNYIPPPGQTQPQLIPIYNYQLLPPGNGLYCPFCRRETDNFPRKVPGGVTYIWCVALFILTGCCCFIPFCS